MIRRLISVTVGAPALAAELAPYAVATTGESVGNVRDATAVYHDPATALAAGYDLLTDAADLACIDQPGAGAMGIHYVKGARHPGT